MYFELSDYSYKYQYLSRYTTKLVFCNMTYSINIYPAVTMFLDHFMQEILRLRLRFGRRDDAVLRVQSVRWSNGIVVTAFRLCDERYDLSSRVPIGRQ